MNRYALFLMLVSVQANIVSALPDPLQWLWGIFRHKETVQAPTPIQPQVHVQTQINQDPTFFKHPKETKSLTDSVHYKINRLVGDDLNEQQRADIVGIENVCNEHFRKCMNQLDYIDEETTDKLYHKEGPECLKNIAIAKELSKYKNYSQEEEATLKKAATPKICNKRLGDIRYLVKSPIGEDVFKEAEKLCDEQREFLNNQRMNDNNEIIQRSFERKLNPLINEQQQENAAPLRNQCNVYLQKFLSGLPYDPYDKRWDKAKEAGKNCIAEYMRIEAEDSYAKREQMEQFNKATQKALGLKAFEHVRNVFHKETPGGLSDLFKKPVNQDCLKRTRILLYKRLGINNPQNEE